MNRRGRGGWGFAIRSNTCETPIHATTPEGINNVLYYVYEVNDDRLTAPEKKPSLEAILTNKYIIKGVNGVA